MKTPCRFALQSVKNNVTNPLRNLGFASLAMLEAAGIHSVEQLHALGAIGAFAKVRQSNPNASLNLLWALEGALTDRNWIDVARDDRVALLLALEEFEKAHI